MQPGEPGLRSMISVTMVTSDLVRPFEFFHSETFSHSILETDD